MTKASVEDAVKSLLVALTGNAIETDPNLKDTPRRVAAYFMDKFMPDAQVEVEIEGYRRAVFPSPLKEMVLQRGVRVFGLCPHHLLPVEYTVAVAYIPSGHVMGLSKLTRMASLYLQRQCLQESGTVQVADALCSILKTGHVAVLVEGKHLCMAVRGVKQDGADTVTAVMRGAFQSGTLRAEFYAAVQKRG